MGKHIPATSAAALWLLTGVALALGCRGREVTEARSGAPQAADTGPSQSRVVRIRYWAQMDVPGEAERATIWMPVPPATAHQTVCGLRVEANADWTFSTDPAYGNTVLRVERTGPAQEPLAVTLHAVVRRQAYSIDIPGASAAVAPQGREVRDESLAFLLPNSFVPIGGKIAAEARGVVSPGMGDAEKARALYEHLTETFAYDKSVPGYGLGDAVRACDVRRGNCTDVHSLFIGMCRSVGIPARLLMGFPLPPDRERGQVPGYHCWAEFYLADVGWVPVDIAEAIKDPSRHEELLAGLDAHRLHFTTGRDIVLAPGAQPGPQNYLIYPVGAADGETQAVRWEFSFENAEG